MPRSAKWGSSPVKTPVLHTEMEGDRKRPRRESLTTSEDSDEETVVMDGLDEDDDATVPLTQDGDDDDDSLDATLPSDEPEDETASVRVFSLVEGPEEFRRFAFSVLASDAAIEQFMNQRQRWLQKIGSIALGNTRFATLLVVDRVLIPPPGQEGNYRVQVYDRYDVEVARIGISETPELIVTQPPDTELEMPGLTLFVNVLRHMPLERRNLTIKDNIGATRDKFEVGSRVRLESRYTDAWFNNPPVFSMDPEPPAKMDNILFASSEDSGLIAYLTF